MADYEALIVALVQRVGSALQEQDTTDLSSEKQRVRAQQLIEVALRQYEQSGAGALDPAERVVIAQEAYQRLWRVDPQDVANVRRQVGDRLVEQKAAYRRSGRELDRQDEQQMARSLISEGVRSYAASLISENSKSLSVHEQSELGAAVFAALYQADRLQAVLHEPGLENLNMIGADKVWVKYAGGEKQRITPIVNGIPELVDMVRRLATWSGLSSLPWDPQNPHVRFRLPDGSRLAAIGWVCEQPTVSIRRNLHPDMSLDKMVQLGSITPLLKEVFQAAVSAELMMVIAGDKGSGKTTTLRALTRELPTRSRIFTVEASLELDLAEMGVHEDVVALEARERFGDGGREVTMSDLVRATRTQDADVVIVGECLGPEVIALLNAALGGTGASMTTLHSRSPKGVPNIIATYAAQSQERLNRETAMMLIGAAVDLVVYMREITDEVTGVRRRVVSDVIEVGTADGEVVSQSTLFRFNPRTGVAEPMKAFSGSQSMEKLREVGFELPATISWGAA